MPKSVLVDLTRCIGCRGCQIACKAWNERGAVKTRNTGTFTNPPEMNAECYTNIRFVEGSAPGGAPVWSFVKDQCLHCQEPACVSVCPVGALRKTESGPVTYNFDVCIGCRYCMLACPFRVPKYEWAKVSPAVQKCTFCSERIREGFLPACVKTCPTRTMFYGEREDVLAEARARLQKGKGRYVPHIYGEEEAGGTSWLYLSAEPFENLGFRTQVPRHALPPLTWTYISKIPYVMGGVLLLGAGAWYATRRKDVEEKEERR